MLCFTKDEDDLLARGWPRMARFVEGDPREKNPKKAALAWIASIDPKTFFSEWPRRVAWRVLRTGPITQIGTAETIAMLEIDGEPSKDEVRAKLVDTLMTFSQHTYEFKICDYAYLVEATLGTDEMLTAMAEGFEKARAPLNEKREGTPMEAYNLMAFAGTVGFMLLRSRDRAKHVARFEAQQKRFEDLAKKNDDWQWCAGMLDLSLHGAAAVRRRIASGWHLDLGWVEYAHDDADLVLECVAKETKGDISVRLVAIAGVAAMRGLAKRKFVAATIPSAIRDFGMVRAPETVDFVLSMLGKSSAKDAPAKWLAAHADFAKPIVERSAKAGNASAKAALSVLKART